MKKILITGSAGFIAPHIAEEALNLGWEVIGVDTQEVENQVKDKKIKACSKLYFLHDLGGHLGKVHQDGARDGVWVLGMTLQNFTESFI